jgi:DNA-binding NtrC family response regulator
MSRAVLIVDDERSLARNLATFLGRAGWAARTAETGREALAALRAGPADLVLLDLRLPDADGIELLPAIRAASPRARIVVITAYASVATAVAAMRAGADDYVAKPLSLKELAVRVERLVPAASEGAERGRGLAAILGDSPPIRELKARIARLLEAERAAGGAGPPVLIVGETGVGKELVARAIHEEGPRAAGPFVELNCTALPATLVESELFGHERGAFTDARESRQGLVEAAHGGTLLLDEIGDLDLAVQAKLLKLLDDRTVRRIGATAGREVDVRFVAATHQPLERRVAEGRFRSDLFFRLRVVELRVPALRERREDVLPLARAFLAEAAARWRRPELALAPSAEAALLAHDWPGNVRELRNTIEQAAVMAEGPRIDAEQLAIARLDPGGTASPTPLPAEDERSVTLEEVERAMLVRALAETGGNVSAAARRLGISRDTLRYRMAKFGLDRRA